MKKVEFYYELSEAGMNLILFVSVPAILQFLPFGIIGMIWSETVMLVSCFVALFGVISFLLGLTVNGTFRWMFLKDSQRK